MITHFLLKKVRAEKAEQCWFNLEQLVRFYASTKKLILFNFLEILARGGGSG